MAISEDQRAMLQLLLDGGQSYEDIASLLGGSADDVRDRARRALEAMGGADPDSHVGLTDYLLGKADPIGRADAVRHLQGDPGDHALATRLLAQLRLLSPQAELPEPPALKAGKGQRSQASAPAQPAAPPAAPVPATSSSTEASVLVPPTPPQPSSPPAGGTRRARMIAGAGGAALLLVVAGLAVAGVFGGDGDDGGGCTTLDTTSATQAGFAAVTLEPGEGATGRDGCPPTGQGVFAAATPNGQGSGNQNTQAQVVLQTNLANLEATPDGQAYIIWLYRSDDFAFPLAQDEVGEDGVLVGGAPIPNQVVRVLPAFSSIRVSLASVAEARQALSRAGENGRLPSFVGQTVLSGDLPAEITQGAQGAQGGASGAGQGQGSGGSGANQGG